MIRIKICGLQDVAAALAAAEAGADAIGLVFAPSKRRVGTDTAREICRALPPFVSKVGVFADEPVATVQETAAYCGLDTLQFHGRESAAYCSQFSQTVIKAFAVKDESSLALLDAYRHCHLLLDSYVPGQPGGTGRVFPWELAVRAARTHRLILAGGLTAENVLNAIQTVKPLGVDVSSGVESNGVKDHDKIRRFVRTIREWQVSLGEY